MKSEILLSSEVNYVIVLAFRVLADTQPLARAAYLISITSDQFVFTNTTTIQK